MKQFKPEISPLKTPTYGNRYLKPHSLTVVGVLIVILLLIVSLLATCTITHSLDIATPKQHVSDSLQLPRERR